MKTIIFCQNKKFFDQDLGKNLFAQDVFNYVKNNISLKIMDKKTKQDITKVIESQLKEIFKYK